MKIEIEDLKKVKIGPEDVFPDNKVIILDGGLELVLAQMHRDFDEVKTL